MQCKKSKLIGNYGKIERSRQLGTYSFCPGHLTSTVVEVAVPIDQSLKPEIHLHCVSIKFRIVTLEPKIILLIFHP